MGILNTACFLRASAEAHRPFAMPRAGKKGQRKVEYRYTYRSRGLSCLWLQVVSCA